MALDQVEQMDYYYLYYGSGLGLGLGLVEMEPLGLELDFASFHMDFAFSKFAITSLDHHYVIMTSSYHHYVIVSPLLRNNLPLSCFIVTTFILNSRRPRVQMRSYLYHLKWFCEFYNLSYSDLSLNHWVQKS